MAAAEATTIEATTTAADSRTAAVTNENPYRGVYNNSMLPHGDMKTGLYKDSFLEDPWKRLIYSRQKRPVESVAPATETGGDNEEGEILLPDDEEGGGVLDEGSRTTAESVVGLGDGLVEAAREVT